MSLADIAALVELMQDDPGNAAALDRFNRTRRPEAVLRVMGIDALNRASMVGLRPLRDIRAAALGGLYAFAPIRRTLMRAGLGTR